MKRSAIVGVMCAGLLGAAVMLPTAANAAPDATADTGSELAGKTVFLDPGHQGTGHSENLSKQVPDGRGGMKDCQTTGMTSLDGIPEHTINWNVSELVKSSLESLGAVVVTSRADDTGWGGCVDDRARAAGESGADVAVSIHADSTSTGADPDKKGFHLIVPTLPIPDAAANAAQSEGGRTASTLMRDAYERAGFTPANYAGVVDGLQERADVAGPALTTVPLVFVEMGNGSNPEDATVLDGSDGQLKHAIAISSGIIDYLLGDGGSADAAAAATTDSATTDSSVPAAGTSASTPSSPAGSGAAGVTKAGESTLSRLISSITPYIDSFGVDGLDQILSESNVDAVTNVAQGLLKQILAGE